MVYNLLLLAILQALLLTGSSVLFATTALVSATFSPNPNLATLEISLQFLTILLMLIPLARAMQYYGRRRVFVATNIISALGMGLLGFAMVHQNFWLFCLAAFPIGVNIASGQMYRFAAVEAAPPAWHGRAISWVLAGGIVAAFAGRYLVEYSRALLQPDFFATYLALVGLSLLAAGLAACLQLPTIDVKKIRHSLPARSLRVIIRQPKFQVAVLAGMVGYGVMNLLMVASPMAIMHAGHSFNMVASALSWHIIAMFFPSFFMGNLIRRFGVFTMIGFGVACGLVAVVAGLLGTSGVLFHVSLIFVGLGWNALYIGGSTLLTETYRDSERGMAQGLNDTLIYGLVFTTSMVSAWLVRSGGFALVVEVAIPALLLMGLALAYLRWRNGARASSVRANKVVR